MVFQLIFDMAYTPVQIYLKFGRRNLIEILKRDPNSTTKFYGPEQVKVYQGDIIVRQPRLKNVMNGF